MIYVDFQKEKFYIDRNGSVSGIVPSTEGLAVVTDHSVIKEAKEQSYKYYSKCGKRYFLEKEFDDTKVTKPKSLFQSMGVRENAIVGIYFEKRLLAFSYRNGALIWRFTSDEIEDKDEIQTRISELGLPENSVIEIYGANIPFERLWESIDRTPVYHDLLHESKRNRLIQIAASASIVALSLLVWGGVVMNAISLKGELRAVRADKSSAIEDLKAGYAARLPYYLEARNTPLDEVLRILSFLEGRKYSALNAIVEHGRISGTLTLQNPEEAYKIKAALKDPKVTIQGDKIDITFIRSIEEDTAPAGWRDYRRLFDLQ